MRIPEYDLLVEDAFQRLRDVDWFIRAISLHYLETARSFDAAVVMSTERLIQTHDVFWDEADKARIKNLPEGTDSLCQFKLSAYLCFWLRRINPVREIRPFFTLADRREWERGSDRITPHCEKFMLYGNEIASLVIAVQLAQFLSLNAVSPSGGVVPYSQTHIKEIDRDTLMEYGMILKHKNISAQGLYMALQMLGGVGQRVVAVTRPLQQAT